MNPLDSTSLTPEEREFAARLARIGPHGEPSAALDARILAAAHAATAPRSTAVHSPRRWPVALGVAASLALALGVAWRVRPLPETRPPYRPEAGAAARMVIAPVQAPGEAAADNDARMPSTAETSEATTVAAKPQAAASDASEDIQTSPAEPQIVLDEAAPQAIAAKAASSPSAPPSPQAFGGIAPDTSQAQPVPPPEAPATRNAASDAPTADTRQIRASAVDATPPPPPQDNAADARNDEPSDDIPPATVDSPAVRDAWLQRIHGLVEHGDVDSARASLREFVRRYPTYRLPEDLRALTR